MVWVYIFKNSPAALLCHQELLFQDPASAEFYRSAFTIILDEELVPSWYANILTTFCLLLEGSI